MTEESYVHEPTDAGTDADATGSGNADADGDGGPGVTTRADATTPAEERPFDWRGWTLVGVVVVSFLVVPGVILALPYMAGPGLSVFGLTWRDTFLVLPLVPAFVLGATAVWATTRP